MGPCPLSLSLARFSQGSGHLHLEALGDLQELSYGSLVVALAHAQADRGSVVGQAEGVDLEFRLADLVQDSGQLLARDGGDGKHNAFLAISAGNYVHGLQADDGEQGRRHRHGIHSCAAGEADGRRDPEAGRSRDAAHHVLLEDNHSGADETNAGHHLRGHAGGIKAAREGVLRYYHEQGAAQSHDEMCAETRLLGPEFTLEAYQAAKHSGDEQP